MSSVLRSVGRWKRDSEVASCEACRAQFGFLKRRHHCRSCGGIFCASCSDKTLHIDVVHHSDAQRVCRKCFTGATAPLAAHPVENVIAEPRRDTQIVPPRANPSKTLLVQPEDTTSKCSTEPPANRETDSPAKSDGSDDSVDDFDRPLDMASRMASAIVSSHCVASTQNLSFLSVLQDGLKKSDADNVMNVLLYASVDRQQAMVVTVEPGETMSDLASRLTEMYFKLENPPFRRMTAEAAAALREKLRFSSEFQSVDLATEAMSVAAQCKNVVLSTLLPEALAQLSRTSARSERSLREFWRSDRSDHHSHDGEGNWC